MTRGSGLGRMSLLAILASLFSLSVTWAGEMSFRDRFYFEPEILASIPLDDDEDEDVEDDLGVAPFFGGRLGYKMSAWASLEFEAGWASFDEEFNGEEVAEFSVIPLLGNIKLDLTAGESRLSPYVYVGFGGMLNDYDLDVDKTLEIFSDEFGVDLSGLGISVAADVKNSFALQVGGGVLYRLNDSISLFADLKWIHAEPDLEATVTVPGLSIEVVVEDENIDFIMVGAGVRIGF